MAKVKQRPLNPYIAGNAIAGEFGFFGREDIFQLVEEELAPGSHQNAVALSGSDALARHLSCCSSNDACHHHLSSQFTLI